MKSKKKYIFSIVFFILLLIATFYLLFSSNDINDVITNLKSIPITHIGIGIVLVLVYLIVEGLYIKITINSLGGKFNLWQGFLSACTEFYFSAITPSSTGGQPAQAYYMHKDGIPYTKSSIALLVNTITFKIIIILMGICAIIFHPGLMFKNGVAFTIFLLIGIVGNFLLIILCLMLMYSKRWIESIVMFFIKLGCRLRIIKDKDHAIESFNTHLAEYQQGAKYVKEHLSIAIKVCILTIIQRFALFSIAFVVYDAFGLEGYSFLDLVVLQIGIALAIDSVPLPGGVGVGEAMMLVIYKKIFGENIAVSAMFLTRGISYYFCLILSSIFVFINHINVMIKEKKKLKQIKKITS